MGVRWLATSARSSRRGRVGPMTELLDLDLPNGRLRVERSGPADAPAVVCVHGLTANLRSFDALREPLLAAGRQMVAIDLRGRGRSADTGPGTYGLDRHADDVVGVADALGLDTFAYVGWSMGALTGLEVVARAGARIPRLALLDAVGGMDDAAIAAVRAGTARLDAVVPTPEPYLDALKASGVFDPWDPFWDVYFTYELAPVDGGLSPSTSRSAVLEDLDVAGRDFTPLWADLTMPTLLVWASQDLGGGLIVPQDVRDEFLARVPTATLHAVDRNHYGIMVAPGVPEAITAHVTDAEHRPG
ncbi:alpha/beta fold hydrolase [Conexibacter sp. W3-3-2]|nr:alpha/beta fold hydrolase [Conexibacter sp. W3-3-2]